MSKIKYRVPYWRLVEHCNLEVHNLQVLWREKRDVRPRNHNLYFGNEFARFSSAQLIYCVHSC
jgi:hypothetical protein